MSGERKHEGTETLIAIGTEASKVLVFNVLGLLVQETPIGAPILALEWVGDMSAPSILPARRVSSACAPRLFALDTVSLESDSEVETGTVKRSVSPIKPTDAINHVPLAHGPDLFTSPPECHTSAFIRRPSDISFGSPRAPDAERPRRRSYPRPRIATETFKSPLLPVSRHLKSQADPLSASAKSSRGSRTRPPNVPSPPIMSPFVAEGSLSEYSQPEDEEPFFTPPTSTRVPTPFQRIQRPISISTDAKASPARTKSPPNSGIMRMENTKRGKGRHVSFPRRSAPKPVDGELESLEYGLIEVTEKLRKDMQELRREIRSLREAIQDGRK